MKTQRASSQEVFEDYILINSTKSPYSQSSANDAFEAALGASNIGVKVKFVFSGLAKYQLFTQQQANKINRKNMLKRLSSLPLFEVEDIYLLSSQSTDESIDAESMKITLIEPEAFKSLCLNASQVLVF
ncbi:DsrE family protein [Glaciecola petra]|uniref:DsrE family protein n=1 Tax=Glaciecola petra TaxID=3075602 RepID=A0ABU2ZNR3_9ALTE|nr:DsrE family protein [Aestuariibacter sp. P117]MDT0594269.1 DsrE family protein [Aestuariibacter sp. P117]